MFCESGESVRLLRERGWPLEKSGELPGKPGELLGKSGKLPGNRWIAVKFHSEKELPGKSPKNFRGSSGNFRGSPGTFQKLGGPWLPPSDSPNLSLKGRQTGGFQTGGFPDLDLSFLSCPPGIFPICPFPLSRPIKLIAAPTRNSPERVRDSIRTFPEKSGKPPGLASLNNQALT